MLNLVSTSDKVQVITSAAVAVDVHASFMDYSAPSTVTPGRTNTAITTAATTDVVAAPAASTQRNVKTLHVRNKHASSSQTVTIQHTDGTTIAELFKATLLAGEEAQYVEGQGFNVFTATGQIKTSALSAVTPSTNGFRLSGVTGTPVMQADSTTLSTIFLAQHKSNQIALYDGANWQLLMPASEVSLAVTGRTTDLPFDIFAFASAGVVSLEFLNWASATARATALARVDGVWTKTGDATRRYLGSCRARSATTFHWVRDGIDLPAKFDLWNVDNRIDFNYLLRALTDSWAYTLATWRQAQGSVNYQVDIMVGLQEEAFQGSLQATSRNTTISIPRQVGIGFDSTTAFTGIAAATANEVTAIPAHHVASIANMPSIGRHFYAWLEISTATGACTWLGDDGALRVQSGMTGLWTC